MQKKSKKSTVRTWQTWFWTCSKISAGLLGVLYSILLILTCPGTFLDNLTNFSNIWAVLGVFFIFDGIFHFKNQRGVFYAIPLFLQKIIKVLQLAGIFVITVCLFLILTPKKFDYKNDSTKINSVILLGGGVSKDGILPKNVVNRVKSCAEYLEFNKDAVVCVSGGTLKFLPVAEGPFLKKELEAMGVESERILVDDQALDTIQNFKYSKILLANHYGCSVDELLEQNILIVTNFYHLHRSQILAGILGYKNVYGLASPTSRLNLLHNYLREICSYLKLGARLLFKKI